MPVSPDEGWFLNPKWFVIAVALAALALIIDYDLRLGLAAGALVGVIAALWLFLVLRLGFLGEDRPSYRRRMLERFRQQFTNRCSAEQREDEVSGA
jgi:hypothetical protein